MNTHFRLGRSLVPAIMIAGLMAALLLVIGVGRANGATLTTSYVRLNRLKAAQTTSFRVQFTTVGAGATSVAINLNGGDGGSGWTNQSGVVNSTQTVSSSVCNLSANGGDTSATPLPGSITAAGAGSTVTISSVTALSATTKYCVDLTSATALTNAVAGEYHPTITVGSDSTTVAIRTISEDSYDVTATVSPNFNFAFNNTTADGFGTLSTGSVNSTTGKTITLTTNASSGWIVWAKSLNGASKGSLNSVTAGNYQITSGSSLGSASHTLTPGTEDYGLAATVGTDAGGGGTVTLDGAYDGTSTKVGVLDSQNFRPVASANGTANGDVLNVLERATISGATPAANDYTDTITFIGAGNF